MFQKLRFKKFVRQGLNEQLAKDNFEVMQAEN